MDESWFSIFFRHNSAPILLVNPDDGNILDANNAALKFYGYSAREIKEMNVSDINTLDLKDLKGKMNDAREKIHNHFYFTHQLADGKHREVEVYSTPFEMGDQHILFSIIHDVTERKKIEGDLKQSEQKFRNFFDNAPIGIYRTTVEGNLLEGNLAFARMLGYGKPEELIRNVENLGRDVYLRPEKREALLDICFKNKGWQKDVNYLKGKNGRRIAASLRQKLVYDNHGEPAYLEGMVEDITERFEAEKKLRESQERYRLIVENQTDLVVKTDAQGVLLFASPSYSRMMGKPEEELLGKMFMEEMDSGGKRTLKNYLQYLESPPHHTYFERQVNVGGKVYWYNWIFTGITDKEGNIQKMIGVGRDITERKMMETSLIKAEKDKSLILDSMSEIVIYYDTGFHIVWASKQANEFFGSDLTDISGCRCTELFPGVSQKCSVCPVEQVKESHQFVETEIQGANNRYWLIRGYPVFDNKASLIGIVSFIQDISKRKEAEEIIQQSKNDLEEKVNARTRELVSMNVQLMNEVEERKRMQQNLAENEQKFRAYIENAPLGIFVTNRKGRYVDVNPFGLKMLGYQKEELLN